VICRKADRAKDILGRCCDKMLAVEDFIAPPPPPAPAIDAVKTERAKRLFQQALVQIGSENLPISLSTLGVHMRKLDQEFDFKQTGFKRLSDISAHFQALGIVQVGTSTKGISQIVSVDGDQLLATDESV